MPLTYDLRARSGKHARLCLTAALATVAAAPPVSRSPEWRARHPAGPPIVTIVAREYAFDAPDSIAAGPTTIRLVSRGKEQHFVGFVRLANGHTLSDYKRALSTKEPTPWATNAGGVGTISPGGSAMVTLPLTRGLYALACDMSDPRGTPHSMKGMLRGLTVFDGPTAAAMPTADVVLGLTDFAFRLSAPLTEGAHVVSVRNAGSQPHMALLWRLHAGKSASDVVHWMDSTGPATAPVTLLGGVPDLDPGQEAQLVLHLAPGRYVLICLVDDVHDHKPHYSHGMVLELTVGAPHAD